jgi:hypothetical protein
MLVTQRVFAMHAPHGGAGHAREGSGAARGSAAGETLSVGSYREIQEDPKRQTGHQGVALP